jgi:hypothetical protein
MNKLIVLSLLSILAFACNRNEQPKPDKSGLFVKFFGAAFDDYGFSEAKADDGGYYLVGSTLVANRQDTNILVVKIDQYGNKVWERTYNLNDDFDEIARDVVVDGFGNIVVAGYKRKKLNGPADFLTLTIDKNNPDLITPYIYGDSLNDEKAYNMVKTPDGAYIIYGSNTPNNTGTCDMTLLKTHLNDTVWTRKIGVLSEKDDIGSLQITASGQLVWCGTVFRTFSDMRIVYADDFGNLMWDYGFDDTDQENEYGYDMAILSDGYIIAGGKSRANNIRDIYLVRTGMNGLKSTTHKNEMIISGTSSQEAYSILALNDNQYVITGYTTTDKGDKNIYIAKVDEGGNILTSASFGGAGNDEGKKVLKTDDGFIIIGTVDAGNNTMMAVYKVNDKLELSK